MRQWLPPLSIALSFQIVTSAADMAVPVLAPIITSSAGVPAAYVGYYASAVSTGAIVFFLLGINAVHGLGPVRALQAGTLVCAIALIMMLVGHWMSILVAGFLIGFGFGTNVPASGVILRDSVPNNRLRLAFSLKQAGVPLGTILVAVTLPTMAEFWSWQIAILTVSALCLMMTTVVSLFHDAPRSMQQSPNRGIMADFRTFHELASKRSVRRYVIAGALLAIAQGSVNAFLVTYLVASLGYSHVIAGGFYSLFHLVGIPGRILSGWLADLPLLRSHMLVVLAVASAAMICIVALLSPKSEVAVVIAALAVLGLLICSWNGVLLAEVSDVVPKEQIAEAHSLTSIGMFSGFVIGPIIFAEVSVAAGDFRPAFLVIVLSTVISAVIVPRRGTC